MSWLVWRQHRQQALFALVGLAVLAAFLVPTGLQMHHEFQRSGLADCLPATARVEFVPANPGPEQALDPVQACQQRASQFVSRYGSRGVIGVLLWFLPLFAGLFWGAPLVAREVEHGTHRLVWTQGVSRLRWALVKFGLVGGGVVLAAACYALLVTWWRPARPDHRQHLGAVRLRPVRPRGPGADRLRPVRRGPGSVRGCPDPQDPGGDDHHPGRVPRHPAGGGALARAHYLAPVRRAYPLMGSMAPNQLTGDWIVTAGIYSSGTRLSGGPSEATATASAPRHRQRSRPPPHHPPTRAWPSTAPTLQPGAFHPADRFWLFQGIETAAFIALAVLLLMAAIHLIRRRIS